MRWTLLVLMIPNWVTPNPREVVRLDIESKQPVDVDGDGTISREARVTGLKLVKTSPTFKLIGARIVSVFVVLPM